MALPIVAIIGRPNVGKSTLFNRLIRRQHAIVDNMPGVTRDRLYRPCFWNGVDFMLVDTGGLWVGSIDPLATQVTEQARIAIEQADVVVFLLDVQVGIQDEDIRIARDLKRSGKKIIITPNKADSANEEITANEFYSLGFDEIYPISSANGRNIGELLDAIVKDLRRDTDEFQEDIKVAIVGRPNVGKSSLINAMTGKNVTIVAPIPGTTRDAIDTRFEIEDKKYLLIDTAGLKKKNIYKDNLEFYTMLRTIKAISRCDIAVVVIDSLEGLVIGDLRIANEAASLFKGIIFAVNKWDAFADKEVDTIDKLRKIIANKAPSLAYVPTLFISALTGLRVKKVWEMISLVADERKKRISTGELNAFIKKIVDKTPPPAKGARLIRIFYVTHAEGDPPTFIMFTNHPQFIDTSYQRFLENRIRDQYGFIGTPIRLIFKGRKE